MVYNWLQRLSVLLIPPTCLLCRAPGCGGRDLCSGCATDLPRIQTPCPGCGLPMPESEHSLRCGACQIRPPPWDSCLSAAAYTGVAQVLVQRFKGQRDWAAGRVLGQLLGDHLQAHYRDRPWPDCIVPVPLHPFRLWRRGFNPPQLVAAQLAVRFQLPLATGCLQRQRATAHQQGLDARARRRNLRGAFRLQRPLPAHIALLDDVVTTGSTASEISRLLKRRGVARIDLWCLARTPKPGE